MLTMTYTNTAKSEVITEKVIVATEKVGKYLIDQWNQQVKEHNMMFLYALVGFAPEPCNYEELGTFTDINTYHKADRDRYDK